MLYAAARLNRWLSSARFSNMSRICLTLNTCRRTPTHGDTLNTDEHSEQAWRGDEATLRMKTAIRIAGSDYSELKALVDLKAETVWRSLPFVP
ncbi:hypothetical protein Ahy_A03g013551 isoform F [Arachis hypogaea]|uniref:Uncharacterized protein n=1 Tax=Arachis hypogaea TaxID=3818 RepID=A0A445DVM1_ARAHY|nr:hypothetical protein Ahy_A03g013551 isoform F [Arachis hypogaea]